MKKDMIGKVLKEARKQNDLSVKEVVWKLKDKSVDIAEKTLYGWESGQALPNADTLLVLCDLYHIGDILGTFGYTTRNQLHITETERKIILNLRAHPEMLPAVKKMLDL